MDKLIQQQVILIMLHDERIDTNKQPTYNCTNMSDAFSVNNTSAKLDYPVGLMSIDELSYAGGEV